MFCTYSDRKYHIANVAAPRKNITQLDALTERERNSRSGINGAFAKRASYATKIASKATPATSNTLVVLDVQPLESLSTMPETSESRPPVTKMAPTTSSDRLSAVPLRSASTSRAANIPTTPIGTLTKRIQRQLRKSVRIPPSNAPAAPPA